jgi:NADH dehydrogenase FAD-containing subunit
MRKTRIIIAGGGFAGLSAATHFDKTLARQSDVEVTLVTRENYILFTQCSTKLPRAIFIRGTSSIRFGVFVVT